MVSVKYNGTVLAESDKTVVVEGNHYFPLDSVNREHFKDSSTSTFCPWKGTASYYSYESAGDKVDDIAWYYAQPKEKAAQIKDHVAFYKSKVEISS
ncbi:hypothetical protein SERLA73DRAFT_138296 [Serpula lacrymans var. lacrymans S7.3]|uniref:DUF427 domain-containing protein n=2 Tax=Serpula lacrymans var. lacrymans TaxID=341189 RepID=F8Q165_SERL3|nr:uncharacterized protein SERLADRAFT_391855 [Serpula lacrymans var. lacrymans S7.9]EGN98043.1 hypothetical protein SERLA73DRAFT_138296 [Serpula lacrymans var. lacrymans S7.3]EGO23633.1 hypothetical protein SERLADRAFT_391855 [Serpula lacrymans var. lacrymans S7.9]